jgi:ferric-dicitrate binding protein FerR (iron transport regulator)
MKRCPFCETENMDDAKYCKECSRSLVQELTDREILLGIRDLVDSSAKHSREMWERHQKKWEEAEKVSEEARKELRKSRRQQRIAGIALIFCCAIIAFACLALILDAILG